MSRRQRATVGLIASIVAAFIAGCLAYLLVALQLIPEDSGPPLHDVGGFILGGLAGCVALGFLALAIHFGRRAFRRPDDDDRRR